MKQGKVSTMLAEVLETDIKAWTDLWPQIRASTGANPTPRRIPRIGWAVGIALVALLAIGGVAVALSLTEKAAEGDAGVNAIYKAGLVTQVNQSQTIDGVTVTLDWVYADPLRVLVAYSTSVEGGAEIKPSTRLADQTTLNGGPVLTIGGVGYVGDTHAEMSDIVALVPPDTSGGPIDAHLALHVLDQSALLTATDVPPGAADSAEAKRAQLDLLKDIGDLAFDVQIPFTAGRTFTPAQDATAAGITMHLTRLIVAPSGIRADVCVDGLEGNTVWTVVGDVSGAGQVTGDGASSAGEIADRPGCFAAYFYEALPLDAPSYTVHITELIGFPLDTPAAQQNRIAGPWTFEVSGE